MSKNLFVCPGGWAFGQELDCDQRVLSGFNRQRTRSRRYDSGDVIVQGSLDRTIAGQDPQRFG